MSNRFRPPTRGPFDTIDPSIYFGSSSRRPPDRKTFQLCRQVERTLSIVLAGECDDDLLRDVLVASVEPAPDASRLLVTVVPTDPRVDADAVLERLRVHKGRLRVALASAVHRKRVPELMFCVGAFDAEDEP